jgi:flagellar motor switch protein FliG
MAPIPLDEMVPQQRPQTMQQLPQGLQQHMQQESQQQNTTQQIMGILNNLPEPQREGILNKYDQAQLPKLIRANFPLMMAVVDVAPGSKVVKEITERPDLHAVLNSYEKQIFMSLSSEPTPEKVAEFLNLPPQKLGEFLSMLTPEELTEILDMLPPGSQNSILNNLSEIERNRIEINAGVI